MCAVSPDELFPGQHFFKFAEDPGDSQRIIAVAEMYPAVIADAFNPDDVGGMYRYLASDSWNNYLKRCRHKAIIWVTTDTQTSD